MLNSCSHNEITNLSRNRSTSTEIISIHSSTSIDHTWDSFHEHYEYLMDEGLIDSCKIFENNSSHLLKSASVLPTNNVSYAEFTHQFNHLMTWLARLKSLCHNTTNSQNICCEQYANQIVYEELLRRSSRLKSLNDYATHLIKYDSNVKKDVLFKLDLLNSKWRLYEFNILSKCFHNHQHNGNSNILKDIQQDIHKFENWINTTEVHLESLKISFNWSLNDLTDNLKSHKKLQESIESQATIINSALKLVTKLKQSSSNSNQTESNDYYDKCLILQNRWHCLWLKSLEWQCRLEQELNRRRKKQALNIKNINTIDTPSTLIDDTDDVIPFYNFEYEKIETNTMHAHIGLPNTTKMNSYYSLTDIKYYNISESELDQSQVQHEQQQLTQEPNVHLYHHDIGYSSGNDKTSAHKSSLTSTTNNNTTISSTTQKSSITSTIYKNNQRKSYSDYGVDRKQQASILKLKKYNKSRHSTSVRRGRVPSNNNNNNDDDDDYDDDDSYDDNYTLKLKHKKKNYSMLNSSTVCFNKSWKQSSTTSAYDTSSNLSNEGVLCVQHKSSEPTDSTANTDTIENLDVLSVELNNSLESRPLHELMNHQRCHKHHDDTYTTNTTDMSDPHWDGYTTFYHASSRHQHNQTMVQSEALLPWDDMFLELDSNDDFVQKFNNNQQKYLKRHSIHNNNNNSCNTLCNNRKKLSLLEHKQHYKPDSLEENDNECINNKMDDIEHILTHSEEKFNEVSIKLQENKSFQIDHTPIYNEIWSEHRTNLQTLMNIKQSIGHNDKIEELLKKWTEIEQILLKNKSLTNEYYDIVDTLNEIEQYLDHVNTLCNQKAFHTIENLRIRIEELVECDMTLSEYLNKFNLLKSIITSSKNFEGVQERVKQVKVLFKRTSAHCKIHIQNLEKNLSTWSNVDQCLTRINIIFDEFKRERVLNDYEQELQECEQKIESIKEYLNVSTHENYLKILQDLMGEYENLCDSKSFTICRTQKIPSQSSLEEPILKRPLCSDPTCLNFSQSANESIMTSTPRGKISSIKLDKSIDTQKSSTKEIRFSDVQMDQEDDVDDNDRKLKNHQNSRDSGINVFGYATTSISENPSYQSSSTCISSIDEHETNFRGNNNDDNESEEEQIEGIRKRMINRGKSTAHVRISKISTENPLVNLLKYLSKLTIYLIILLLLIAFASILISNLGIDFNSNFGVLLFNRDTYSSLPTPY